MAQDKVSLRDITQDTLRAILDLEVHDSQKNFVAPNAVSIAQAHFSKYAWFLNVLEQFRRKGIATQLMDRAEAEIAKRSDIAGIGVGLYSDYGPAQRMYILRGYVPDARGLMYAGKPVTPGTSVIADDSLTMNLTKNLT